MRWTRVASFALIAAAIGCGGGSAQVQVMTDGGDAPAAPEVGAGDRPDAGDVAEAAPDVPPDLAAEAEAGPDASPADAGQDADGATDAAMEAAAERPADAGPEAPADVSGEKPPATASWSIGPDPMCEAAATGCMDTGPVGGYQITASATCAGAPSVRLWFPGGAPVVAAGSYAVKQAEGIFDVIAMPAGMVGIQTERTDAATHTFWGRAGTVTVTAAGTARHVTFTGVTMKEEGTAAMTTLAADVTCP
jgi:hypothetical protein